MSGYAARLNVAVTAVKGTALSVKNMREKYYQVEGIAGGAVVQIFGRVHPSDGWLALTAAINANSTVPVSLPHNVSDICVDRTTLGTGLPTVSIIGLVDPP